MAGGAMRFLSLCFLSGILRPLLKHKERFSSNKQVWLAYMAILRKEYDNGLEIFCHVCSLHGGMCRVG